MRSDIVPGALFPDYELSDHTAKRRKLSQLQGQHPMVLVLSRGGFCPKDRRQHEGLVELHRELEVAYCRLVTISTDNISQTNEYRSGVGGSTGPSSPTRGVSVQKDLDIAEYTGSGQQSRRSLAVIVLEPGLVIQQGLQRLLVLRPAHDGRPPPGPACRYQEMPAGLGHHNARTQSGVAARPQGTILSVRQNACPNSR